MEAEWGDVVRFLTYLAEEREIVPTGQNQCFNALLFFFRYACDGEAFRYRESAGQFLR